MFVLFLPSFSRCPSPITLLFMPLGSSPAPHPKPPPRGKARRGEGPEEKALLFRTSPLPEHWQRMKAGGGWTCSNPSPWSVSGGLIRVLTCRCTVRVGRTVGGIQGRGKSWGIVWKETVGICTGLFRGPGASVNCSCSSTYSERPKILGRGKSPSVLLRILLYWSRPRGPIECAVSRTKAILTCYTLRWSFPQHTATIQVSLYNVCDRSTP